MLRMPYLHNSNLRFQAVDFAYGDSNFVATIILPDPDRDLDALIAELNMKNWNDWSNSFHAAGVTLHLPRFKLESDYLLDDALVKLGMRIAFTPGSADFSKMSINSGAKNLSISRVIHKAVIEVTEAGTEAGAGTVVEMSKSYSFKTMIVNRPFLFVIRDTNSGVILFMSRVADPTVQNPSDQKPKKSG
jgi:serine protease inhibitor